MYIETYQIENYLIEIPDDTPTDEMFDKVQREWKTGSYTPYDGHTFIGDAALEASKFLLDHALELHKHQLEEFCTVLYQKLDEKYDISVTSVVDSTIKVECKIGPLLHSKIIKAETIDKTLDELKPFFEH